MAFGVEVNKEPSSTQRRDLKEKKYGINLALLFEPLIQHWKGVLGVCTIVRAHFTSSLTWDKSIVFEILFLSFCGEACDASLDHSAFVRPPRISDSVQSNSQWIFVLRNDAQGDRRTHLA